MQPNDTFINKLAQLMSNPEVTVSQLDTVIREFDISSVEIVQLIAEVRIELIKNGNVSLDDDLKNLMNKYADSVHNILIEGGYW